MARIRTIKPDFFRSHELYVLELRANKGRQPANYLNIRMAFAGLFTVADREGRFEWRPPQLKLDCLPFDAVDFSEVLEVLATNGTPPFIRRYEVAGKPYGHVTGFLKHQRPKVDEAQSVLPAPPDEKIADSMLPGLEPESGRTPTGVELTQGREGKGREGKGSENGCVRAGAPHPTLAEVAAYCRERGNKVDPVRWLDHYTSNGWKVGRNAMKDWRAAVRTWEKNEYGQNGAARGSKRVVGGAAPVAGKYDHIG